MPLEDKDIFNAIFSKYEDQPIEFVMEQYEKARQLNSEIEQRMAANMPVQAEEANDASGTRKKEPPKKKYTRRNLVVKPEEAIGKDYIKCCICGEQKVILTKAHLAMHGITPEEYRMICV